MVRQRLAWLCYGLAIVLAPMLAACATTVLPTLIPASATPSSAMATVTAIVTATPTAIATSSLVSPTHAPTTTATPAPTLTAEQAAEFVIAMIMTNGGCELPCWWGITPGKTNHQAIKDFFSSQGIRLFSDAQGSDLVLDMPHTERLFEYRVHVSFDTRNETVRYIKVNSEIYRGETSERFIRDWKRYAWDQVLTRYGPPSWVGIAFQPPMEPNAPIIYGLSLIYEPLGFEISYTGPAQYDTKASVMRTCPDFNAVTAINLRLASPEDSVVELLLSESRAPSLGPSLEETTEMSVQTFYETFKNANSRACLEELSHLNNP